MMEEFGLSASLLLFALTMTVTPGPNNIMLMTASLNHGWRKSLPLYFGICLGFPIMLLTVGLGLASFMYANPAVHRVFQIMAFIYLVYLAYKIARSAPPSVVKSAIAPFTFIQAALFQWINPKAWSMGMGAFALFVTEPNPTLIDVAMVPLHFLAVGLPSVAVWLLLGRVLTRFLNRPLLLTWFNRLMAVLVVASVLPPILS